MVQRGRRAGFLLEARQALGIGGEGRRQDLDGDIASQAGITRAIHVPHAAAAERSHDFIGPESRAGRECHFSSAAVQF